MNDKAFDELSDEARVRLTDNLVAINPLEAISDINCILDLVSNNSSFEINRIVYLLSCISDMFLGLLTSNKVKLND